MNEGPSLSVVVASHGRPRALRRCLIGLSQSAMQPLEAIVVADKAGLEIAAALPFGRRLKTVLQVEPNLSKARNDGIAQAAGDLVAFIDDDAVPEPTWAGAMAAAFAGQPDLAAATGPVLGRNGISVQWGPMAVDREGRDRLLVDGDSALPDGVARKLHGTNMALRRDVLLEIGAFDQAFHFYLDDTDLALRLGRAGKRTAWISSAQVHHSFAASARRNADRIPLSLFDVGASTAAFLRKHSPDALESGLAQLAVDQRDRLFRLARRRKLGARGIRALLDTLRDGIAEGRVRPIGDCHLAPRRTQFSRLSDTGARSEEIVAGSRFRTRALRAEAERLAEQGARVSLFLFEPTPRAHRVVFTEGGWWEQTGGLYGRSDRNKTRLQAWTFGSRLVAELERIGATRFVNPENAQFPRR